MKRILCMVLAILMFGFAANAEEFHMVFYGDWNEINKASYQEELAEVFHSVYPRLYARWGRETAPRLVYFEAASEGDVSVAASYLNYVVLNTEYANRAPYDLGYFAHELTHTVQGYNGRINYGGDAWWVENMANYGRFRYFHWTDAKWMEPSSIDPDDWMDWGYTPYGNCQWFFAYMDDRYPTVIDENGTMHYGLIDAIHRLIYTNEGEMLNDNPYLPETPINRLVNDITSYESIDALRLRFAEELREGTWSFNGFSKYKDNFLTENLNGIQNPEYPSWEEAIHTRSSAEPMAAVTEGENLCLHAGCVEVSGFVNEYEAPEMLTDGDPYTKWCSTSHSVSSMKYAMDGAGQWIVLDLGEEKEFDTYTVLNTKTVESYYGNMVSWELMASSDGVEWRCVDYQTDCNLDMVSFHVGMQKARYLLLKAYRPDDGEVGTIRLYELMLFKMG